MATITPVDTTAAINNTLTYAAASGGGDTVVVPSGRAAKLLVRNASGGSITVTLAGVVVCSQGSTHNATATCAVGDTEVTIPPQCVNPASGNVGVTYSATTSITVAAVV